MQQAVCICVCNSVLTDVTVKGHDWPTNAFTHSRFFSLVSIFNHSAICPMSKFPYSFYVCTVNRLRITLNELICSLKAMGSGKIPLWLTFIPLLIDTTAEYFAFNLYVFAVEYFYIKVSFLRFFLLMKFIVCVNVLL